MTFSMKISKKRVYLWLTTSAIVVLGLFILWAILPGIGLLVGILCVLGIIGGIGLFARRNWARILVLILSAIDLVNFPLGTALGIYSIWVLVQQDTVTLMQKQS